MQNAKRDVMERPRDRSIQAPNGLIRPRSFGLWVLWCLGVFAAGCGGSYSATVSGKVAMNGSPLTKGTVSFHPVAGGPVATGQIQNDGTFTVQTATKEGLPPGEYKVTVVATDPPPPPGSDGEGLPGKLLTSPQFGRVDSTPLQFTVNAGANSFDNIEVQPAPAE